ncbi:MAG: urea carboxylase-associated family protein [Solirubrobacterales bacterium]
MTETQHPRPFNGEFYAQAPTWLRDRKPRHAELLDRFEGRSLEVQAGELLTIELAGEAQIVNFLPFNANDPDERFWAHETCLIEGLWLTRNSRLWGTMARFRPLMTVVEETVRTLSNPGAALGKHHPVYGGSGTPRDWRNAGGSAEVPSTWEQFAAALELRGLSPSLIKDNACFFQKTAIDPVRHRLVVLPSDASPGDRVTLFAEVDLMVLVAPSPYVDGSTPASAIDTSSAQPVRIEVCEKVAEPMPWPYEGIPYPDLSLYLGKGGTRTSEVGPTPGLESNDG